MGKFQITIDIPEQVEQQRFAYDFISNMIRDIEESYQVHPQQEIEIESNQLTIKSIIDGSGLEVIKDIKQLQGSTGEIVPLYHVKVHQQFVPNVCGYHASFNILLVVEALKERSNQVRLVSSGQFWRFKSDVCKYIMSYKNKYESQNEKWPWREKDVKEGDFERQYLKLCLLNNQRFVQTLSSTNDTLVLYHTWEYQFGRSLSNESDQAKLQEKMNQFQEFQAKGDKQAIFVMMLGITNHWGAFVALKNKQGIEFAFLDSRNRDYLNWNEKEISAWIVQEQEKRLQMGRKQMTEFDIEVQKTCVKDIQESLDILCQCLLGNTNLYQCQCNSLFQTFEKQFKSAVCYSEVLSQREIQKNLDQCQIYAKDFYYTIQSFFKTPKILKFLWPQNLEKFKEMKTVFTQLQKSNKTINPKTYHQSYIEPLINILNKANL